MENSVKEVTNTKDAFAPLNSVELSISTSRSFSFQSPSFSSASYSMLRYNHISSRRETRCCSLGFAHTRLHTTTYNRDLYQCRATSSDIQRVISKHSSLFFKIDEKTQDNLVLLGLPNLGRYLITVPYVNMVSPFCEVM